MAAAATFDGSTVKQMEECENMMTHRIKELSLFLRPKSNPFKRTKVLKATPPSK